MEKYNIHISSTTNLLSDPNWFPGTGFMGQGFSTREDLLALLKKYATYKKDGESYWQEEIKLTFELGETVAKFKEEGDRQCKVNGFVNLFAAAAVCAKDPFHGIEVIYRPGGWIDAQGNEFKFVLITKEDEVIPKKGKLTDILRELGMEIQTEWGVG